MRLSLRAEAFDGGDALADGGGDGSDAGADGFAVEVDSAGAALGDAAAVFGAGEGEVFADHPQQRSRRIDLKFQNFAVELQPKIHSAKPFPTPQIVHLLNGVLGLTLSDKATVADPMPHLVPSRPTHFLDYLNSEAERIFRLPRTSPSQPRR